MALINCPECEKEASDTAKTCPNCGFAIAEHIANDRKRAKKEEADKQAKGCLYGCLWILILAIIGSALLVMTGPDEGTSNYSTMPELQTDPSTASTRPNPNVPKAGTDTAGAWAYTQIYVKKQLKSPSTAKFPWTGVRDVEPRTNNIYMVKSYVDAQNAFGATVRQHFICEIQDIDEGWKVISFEFVE